MKNQTLILGLLCCALLGFGCDDDANRGSAPARGGAGPMMTPSTPPAPPQAMPDGGTMPMDTPPAPSTPPTPPAASACTVDVSGGLPALPMACLPRCSSATLDSIRSCTDSDCQRTATQSDTTPTITLTMTAEGEEVDSADLSCDMCFNLMNNSCVSEICSTQMQAFIACRGTGGTCEAESAAISSCLMTNDGEYRSCQNSRLPLCFAAS